MNSQPARQNRQSGLAPEILEVPTTPYPDQRPGTSGLRRKTRTFMQPRYLENFIQAVFDVVREESGDNLAQETLVVGGDGRYYNRTAIQRILRMAAANGFGRILVARDGLLSTPAMSAVIRTHGAAGGLILSASHNPGGADADFGVKFNGRNGGPASERVTDQIHQHASGIRCYKTVEFPDIDLGGEGETFLCGTWIRVIDPLADYTALLETLFDFDALRRYFHQGGSLRFDAMHGVTGPYARHIFEQRLDAPHGTVIRGEPREDFGGLHPDPNLVHARELVDRMNTDDGPDLGAACDGDGDRNMILGRGLFVSPGDSLAVIAEHARDCIPAFRDGLTGVARSMPTSTAVDRVAAAVGVPCFETPTGWKFFGDLLDAGLCRLCGEESFGTGSDHVREKDGIWAVLCWLSILAETRKPVTAIMHEYWRRFGRSYYQRHDFEKLDADAAQALLADLTAALPKLPGTPLADSRVALADDFRYRDPVTNFVTEHGGLRILLEDGSRIVCRLSGTGTSGATLRLYLERYRDDRGRGDLNRVLAPLREAALELLQLRERCGRESADVVT